MPAEFICCELEGEFVRGVLREMDPRPDSAPSLSVGRRDTSTQRILTLLAEEAEQRWPSGRLYSESLVHALATRYLLLGEVRPFRTDSRTSPLPSRILNRIREKIESSLHADVSLEALAEESGYSRAHFLRMFRAATGVTPHQYILDMRLTQAQEWLRQKHASLIDIAAMCGFSSQSHMTNVFRKRLGVTPAEFRRNR
jgi:AraC family transcriptional regulator